MCGIVVVRFVNGGFTMGRGVVCLYDVAVAFGSSLILWAVYVSSASYPFIYSQVALFRDNFLLLWFVFGLHAVVGTLLYFPYAWGVLEW